MQDASFDLSFTGPPLQNARDFTSSLRRGRWGTWTSTSPSAASATAPAWWTSRPPRSGPQCSSRPSARYTTSFAATPPPPVPPPPWLNRRHATPELHLRKTLLPLLSSRLHRDPCGPDSGRLSPRRSGTWLPRLCPGCGLPMYRTQPVLGVSFAAPEPSSGSWEEVRGSP